MTDYEKNKLDHIQSLFDKARETDPKDSRGQMLMDLELSSLMTELERIFKIPLFQRNAKDFEKEHPEVMQLYQRISLYRKL